MTWAEKMPPAGRVQLVANPVWVVTERTGDELAHADGHIQRKSLGQGLV